MTTPNEYPPFYDEDISPANALLDPGTKVLLGHTGTLMTDGQGNGDYERTGTFYGQTVNLGPDVSAASINPYLDPDLSTLPDGYDVGPTLTGPVY